MLPGGKLFLRFNFLEMERTRKIFFCGSLLLAFGFSSFAFADEKKGKDVDIEMGGMEEGSRVPAPQGGPEQKSDGLHPLSSPQAPATKPDTGPAAVKKAPVRKFPVRDIPAETIPAGTDAAQDTLGEVEEKEIFELDLEAEGVDSIDDVVTDSDVTDSAEEVVEKEVVEKTPEEPVVETPTDTTTEAPTAIPAETTTETETPTETSDAPIVDVGVGADLESGQVKTEVAVDTSGELEERQIVDADVDIADTASVDAEVGSAVDITQSEIVEEANITTEPIQAVVAKPLDVSADVDTTGESIGGEADVGVEAEVSDTSESDEVACDPADSLLPDPSCDSPAMP